MGASCNSCDTMALISLQARLVYLVVGTWEAHTSPWPLAFCCLCERIVCITLCGYGLVDRKINETKNKATVLWAVSIVFWQPSSLFHSLCHFMGEIYLVTANHTSYWQSLLWTFMKDKQKSTYSFNPHHFGGSILSPRATSPSFPGSHDSKTGFNV